MKLDDDTIEIAKQVKLLVLDVDGVLTDGGIYFDDSGKELKKFNSLDGYGIKMLLSSGFEVAVISSRSTPSVAHRMEGLGVKYHFQGQSDKNIKMQQILETLSLNVDQVAFVGDDVIAGGATKIFTNAPKGRVLLGYPAVKMETHISMQKALRRLPRLFKKLS